MQSSLPCWVGILFALFAVSGCRSCQKEKPQSASPVSDVGSPPAGVVVEEQKPATAISSQSPAEERPLPRMYRLPASYFQLDRQTHTLQRVKTERLGAPNPNVVGAQEIQGFTLAIMGEYAGEEEGDKVFEALPNGVYEELIRQKVFTVAKPWIVVWNAGTRSGKFRWSPGVPVPDSAEVREPLRTRRIPPLRAFVVRGIAKEVGETYLPNLSEKTFWDLLDRLDQRLNTGVRSTFFALRLADFDAAPFGDNGLLEVIVGVPMAGGGPGEETADAPPPSPNVD